MFLGHILYTQTVSWKRPYALLPLTLITAGHNLCVIRIFYSYRSQLTLLFAFKNSGKIGILIFTPWEIVRYRGVPAQHVQFSTLYIILGHQKTVTQLYQPNIYIYLFLNSPVQNLLFEFCNGPFSKINLQLWWKTCSRFVSRVFGCF